MFTFNVVVFGDKGERGYFVNNVRFNRDQWRSMVEYQLEATKQALVFQNMQVAQIQFALKSAQSIKDGKAAFPLPPDSKQIYRQVIAEIREELAMARYAYEQGELTISQLEEMLED